MFAHKVERITLNLYLLSPANPMRSCTRSTTWTLSTKWTSTAQAVSTVQVHVKQASIADHAGDCAGGDVTGAYFIINQISAADAPTTIDVTLADGTTQTVAEIKQSGSTAHYDIFFTGTTVSDATAYVPVTWDRPVRAVELLLHHHHVEQFLEQFLEQLRHADQLTRGAVLSERPASPGGGGVGRSAVRCALRSPQHRVVGARTRTHRHVSARGASCDARRQDLQPAGSPCP